MGEAASRSLSPSAKCQLEIGNVGPPEHPEFLQLPDVPRCPSISLLSNLAMPDLLLPMISSRQDRAGSGLALCAETDGFTLDSKDTAGWDRPGASRRLAEEGGLFLLAES